MRKMVCKVLFGAMMAIMMTSTVFGAGWKQDNIGWWWQNDDGSWLANKWEWLDGNNDGVAECYYFNESGYMLANTKTPDGYWVNENGAWVDDGDIMLKAVATHFEAAETEKETVVENVTSDSTKNSANWEQTAAGWKYRKPDGAYVVDSMYLIDSDGDGVYKIYSFDTNGILYQDKGGKDYSKFGSFDESGCLLTSFYRGGDAYSMGPYEVVKKNGAWYCINGTMPEKYAGCADITDDYAWDAVMVKGWIDYDTLARQTVSYTEYWD